VREKEVWKGDAVAVTSISNVLSKFRLGSGMLSVFMRYS
jgi:hypothetical protein